MKSQVSEAYLIKSVSREIFARQLKKREQLVSKSIGKPLLVFVFTFREQQLNMITEGFSPGEQGLADARLPPPKVSCLVVVVIAFRVRLI